MTQRNIRLPLAAALLAAGLTAVPVAAMAAVPAHFMSERLQQRQEQRDDRRNVREERRDDQRGQRQEQRDDRRNAREERRDDRRPAAPPPQGSRPAFAGPRGDDRRQSAPPPQGSRPAFAASRGDDRRDFRNDRRDDRRDFRNDRRDVRDDRRDDRRDFRNDRRNDWRNPPPARHGYVRTPPPARYAYYDARRPTRVVHHHHYNYPRRGYVTHALPRNVIVVNHYRDRYWYDRGTWYAPRGSSFVVVAPPLGVFVSLLPSVYSTVWFGGAPYYYANDVYYAWRPQQRAYQVVESPYASGAGPVIEDIFVYPREGQSQEELDFDRYECHRWAADETGFDPTLPDGGVGARNVASARSDYLRAMTACLEARGYSVR